MVWTSDGTRQKSSFSRIRSLLQRPVPQIDLPLPLTVIVYSLCLLRIPLHLLLGPTPTCLGSSTQHPPTSTGAPAPPLPTWMHRGPRTTPGTPRPTQSRHIRSNRLFLPRPQRSGSAVQPHRVRRRVMGAVTTMGEEQEQEARGQCLSRANRQTRCAIHLQTTPLRHQTSHSRIHMSMPRMPVHTRQRGSSHAHRVRTRPSALRCLGVPRRLLGRRADGLSWRRVRRIPVRITRHCLSSLDLWKRKTIS